MRPATFIPDDPKLDLKALAPEVFWAYRDLSVRKGWRNVWTPSVPKTMKLYGSELWKALRDGDVEAVRKELTEENMEEEGGLWGWTPLHYACCKGKVEVVQLLLDKGASVRARSDDNRYPLSMAMEYGHLDCAEALLKNSKTFVMEETLFQCVERDSLEGLKLLLQYDQSTSPLDGDLLLQASQNGNLAMTTFLIQERGVRVTELHRALGSSGECITALLNAGVSPHVADKYGVTAVHIAAAFGMIEPLKALLAFDPTVLRKATVEGFMALELAVLGRRVASVQTIMQCKASNGVDWMIDIDDRTYLKRGHDALCLACAIPSPDVEVVEALCQRMEFDSHLTWTLQTPLHLARHSQECSEILRKHGCRICKHGLENCTKTVTGTSFAEQQWWHCITCGLVGDLGVCVYCLNKCHAGHKTVGPMFSGFFCDCKTLH